MPQDKNELKNDVPKAPPVKNEDRKDSSKRPPLKERLRQKIERIRRDDANVYPLY